MKNGAPGPSSLKPEKDLESHLSSLDNVPLFMKDLPNGSSEDTSALDALHSLTFDGTPDEVATNFKNQGNEYFIGKRYKEARGFYTQGLDAYPKDVKLQETLLINRAACNLELENYGMTLKDCSEALGLNSRSSKAFYRSARALLALERFIEAIDCCDHALEIDKGNETTRVLRSKIVEKKVTREKKEAESKERERREKEIKLAINRALLARGLWIESSLHPPDNPNPAHFDPEVILPSSKSTLPLLGDIKWSAPDPIRTPMIFPMIFLYPTHYQSDLISHFHEDTTLASHLEMMFPINSQLPWDEKGQYIHPNLIAFATTKKKRLLKLGKKLTLREILDQGSKDVEKGVDRDGIVMLDGFISIVILPRGSDEKKWIDSFKAERDGSK